MRKLGDLEKRVTELARKPTEQTAYEEGLRQAAGELANGLRLLPIETQDQVIEALKRSKEKSP